MVVYSRPVRVCDDERFRLVAWHDGLAWQRPDGYFALVRRVFVKRNVHTVCVRVCVQVLCFLCVISDFSQFFSRKTRQSHLTINSAWCLRPSFHGNSGLKWEQKNTHVKTHCEMNIWCFSSCSMTTKCRLPFANNVDAKKKTLFKLRRFYARAVQLANLGALTRIIFSGVLLSKFWCWASSHHELQNERWRGTHISAGSFLS